LDFNKEIFISRMHGANIKKKVLSMFNRSTICSVSVQPISEHAVVFWVTFRLSNIDRGILKAEHVDSIGEIGNTYRILMGKLRGMCPLDRSKRCDDIEK